MMEFYKLVLQLLDFAVIPRCFCLSVTEPRVPKEGDSRFFTQNIVATYKMQVWVFWFT